METAERHVRQAENCVTRQEALSDRLQREGRDVTDANVTLETMRETLRLMRDHLRIEQERITRIARQRGTARPAHTGKP